jgi:lysophospholipase L1-like esterase
VTARIVIFGDSLSEGTGPGAVMGAALREDQRVSYVMVEARRSRSAWNFYAREEHAAVIAQVLEARPSLVVVWLGTNELGLSAKTNRAAFTRLRDDLGKNGARVIAIGPPAFADAELRDQATAVYATMREVFATVVDARPRSLDLREAPYRASDGVHFTARGAAVLGPRLADDVLGGARSHPSLWVAGAAIGIAVLVTLISRGGAPM